MDPEDPEAKPIHEAEPAPGPDSGPGPGPQPGRKPLDASSLPPSGYRAGPWRALDAPPRLELCAVADAGPLTLEDFSFRFALYQRVYGTLILNEAGRCLSIETRYDVMDRSGNRAPFTVDLQEDHVGVLVVEGHLVREVWVGYVRSLALCDLVAAVPAMSAIVDQLRVDVERDDLVRTVRTTAHGLFAQQVEVVSVVGLLSVAARIGFDAAVEGRPFWEWAARFPECVPFTGLYSFRIHTGRHEETDHRDLQPAPSHSLDPRTMLSPTHPFRATLLAHYPRHDWVRRKDWSRPVPDVPFAPGAIEELIYEVGSIQATAGRAAAIARVGALRALVPALGREPTFEGHRLMTRVEHGVPYVWMGGIEDALGFWIPIGLVERDAYPAHGTVDGDLAYYEVDPYVPAMLRRNHDGRRGRSARTTAWIHLDGVPDMLARVRADLVARGEHEKVLRLDRFARTFVADLDVYLREQVGGVALGCPTDSGRQVFVTLDVDGERCPILFDPFNQTPWLTYEQLARILGISFDALKHVIARVRKKGIIPDDAFRTRMGVGRDGRRNSVTYVSWLVVTMISHPMSTRRHMAVSSFVATASMDMRATAPMPETYRLADFSPSK